MQVSCFYINLPSHHILISKPLHLRHTNILQLLENKFIEEVREKQKYRMFGYVGRKDYSLNGLLDCYKKLPLNEEKLCITVLVPQFNGIL